MNTLMTEYTFSVNPCIDRVGFDITLDHKIDPVKKKRWYVAYGTQDGHERHMRSLTDTLCDEFFPKPRVKKEKKAKDEANSSGG